MTDDELKDLVASLAITQKETDRQLQETGFEKNPKVDNRRARREVRAQLPIGWPCARREHFGMDVVTPRRSDKQGTDPRNRRPCLRQLFAKHTGMEVKSHPRQGPVANPKRFRSTRTRNSSGSSLFVDAPMDHTPGSPRQRLVPRRDS